MIGDIYTLKSPQNLKSCSVFSSPHSGSRYPAELLASTKLDSVTIRSSEDAFVDELYADAPKFGAHLVVAHVPRAYIDLNRGPDELDPAIIRGAKRRGSNPRIAVGLGVIPRVVGENKVIRTGKMTLSSANERIGKYYVPYHNCLADRLAVLRAELGMAILFDCHSMPNRALDNAPLVNGKRPDVILGNRFGAASDRWILDATSKVFETAGFVVAHNAPFSGGFITQHYGRPTRGIHAIQIEINRSIYMNEETICRSPDFQKVCGVMSSITQELAKVGPTSSDMAAE